MGQAGQGPEVEADAKARRVDRARVHAGGRRGRAPSWSRRKERRWLIPLRADVGRGPGARGSGSPAARAGTVRVRPGSLCWLVAGAGPRSGAGWTGARGTRRARRHRRRGRDRQDAPLRQFRESAPGRARRPTSRGIACPMAAPCPLCPSSRSCARAFRLEDGEPRADRRTRSLQRWAPSGSIPSRPCRTRSRCWA